jgi:hypothetical protein
MEIETEEGIMGFIRLAITESQCKAVVTLSWIEESNVLSEIKEYKPRRIAMTAENRACKIS